MNFILEVFAYMLLLASRTLYSRTEVPLPKPELNYHVVNSSEVIGWPKEKMPAAPGSFIVKKFAEELKNPRMVFETPDHQLLVAESKANRISLLEDKNNDGFFESKQIVLKNLRRPFGMMVLGEKLYVANEDSVWTYPYTKNISQLNEAAGKKILDLPSGGGHWTRNIIAAKNGKKIYIAVGSASNIAEDGMDAEKNRAAILEANPDGTELKIFASGLRNPVGLGWAPGTEDLWTTVNERDLIGEDLVPDFFTKVRANGFYGWPYSYIGSNIDPRIKEQRPELVKNALVPDVRLQAHSANLGFAFYEKRAFPSHYHDGAFIAQHGSWNRKKLAGYRVIFIPFKNGRPSGAPEDFLTGFIANEKKSEVYGRPVGITVMDDGSLLVADDGADVIWRISYKK